MSRRIAVVGGGIAGLAAAWHLSRPDGDRPQVTVYQRGARLGGKAASSRGPHARIEEHGLHVWLGHYDNAFRLLRACYAELDRTTTDPGCPIAGWRDAVVPAHAIGAGDDDGSGWAPWVATFPGDDRVPGEPDADGTVTPAVLLRRVAGLLGRAGSSLGPIATSPRVVLSAHSSLPPAPGTVVDTLGGLLQAARTAATDPRAARRAAGFADFLVAFVRGVLADDLLRRGFGAVDDEELRGWLRRHGASAATVDGPFVRALHDLAFAYAEGDVDRPTFPAGTGLHLANRTFGDYKGALFWKMRAGMGDVVVAPLYQALRARGVRFRFFHRLDGVHLDARRRSVQALTFGRQVDLAPGAEEYDPLVRIDGLPVFPTTVDLGQVAAGADILDHDLESHWSTWPDAGRVRLEAGTDFDAVVLAVSIGMLPATCRELIAADDRWRAMVDNVATVATQAFQLWLTPDERQLGWPSTAPSITSVGRPFDTFASMSHVLPFEQWPVAAAPRTAASFCAVMPETSVPRSDDRDHARKAAAAVHDAAVRFLDEKAGRLWPAAVQGGGGFRWDLLASGPEGVAVDGPARFATQYWRANTDPSDRYVQATPGAARFRLRADASGFDNLVLAGDWTDNGVNVGCIEAAVVSGVQAANAALGARLDHGVTAWQPHRQEAVAG
jgi:uncharacterized protein with NAD-binding domain and iron-sulfur cluster